jgi:hypothetical protein
MPRRNSLPTVSDSETTGKGVAPGVGLALSVTVGVAIDKINLGVWVSMALGAALGHVGDQQEAEITKRRICTCLRPTYLISQVQIRE